MSNSAHSRSTILGLGLVGMLGILAGLSWFTFNYAKGSAYLSDEPQACANCHVMRDQFTAWQHSSHARVASCNDCHTPHGFPDKWLVKALNGFNHSAVFTLGGFHEPIRIREFNAQVVELNCVRCHQALVSQIYALHPDQPIRCIACHGSVGHRTRD